ncbi:Uncharacterised protein [Serratia fonticola]|uniref:Uncharacterized protein n=1 Tax=Serratia fonticola TaxID=47917 RepID=A0A4U9TVY6_SERFO|nr:Uncharacterised protein [Serratia fonticola]
MSKIALLFAMLFCTPLITACSASEPAPAPQAPLVAQQLLGSPVYIQIFKEETQAGVVRQDGQRIPPGE